ncbi:hypothetical protein CYMTET_12415 [Cymbomonas tetramitiformis]|uniref:EF-hand domain-containing protein n=1 Tax=Cymbomonas tetramitiformis TaxID=36881 RepID=A0AAE0GKG8_9CHLO|nr:hypothetical protein CYMTET_12415 [Cymbomonas tetramitiformis]
MFYAHDEQIHRRSESLFRTFDKNRDGCISLAEFSTLLVSSGDCFEGTGALFSVSRRLEDFLNDTAPHSQWQTRLQPLKTLRKTSDSNKIARMSGNQYKFSSRPARNLIDAYLNKTVQDGFSPPTPLTSSDAEITDGILTLSSDAFATEQLGQGISSYSNSEGVHTIILQVNVSLTSELPRIKLHPANEGNLTIMGQCGSMNGRCTVDAHDKFQVLTVEGPEDASSACLHLMHLHLTHGYAGVAYSGGGALFARYSFVDILNCAFSWSAGTGVGGGGLLLQGGSASLRDSEVHNCLSEGIGGGGIGIMGAMVDIYNCTIAYNEGNNGGGIGMLTDDTDQNFPPLPIYIADSTISNNSAVENGGGIAFTFCSVLSVGDEIDVYVWQSSISQNFAIHLGGGMWVFRCHVAVSNASISSNQADGGGGALHLQECDFDFDGVRVERNLSPEGGGFTSDDARVTVMGNVSFEANVASDGDGGAFMLRRAASLMTMAHAFLVENQALAGNGGAIAIIEHAQLELFDSRPQLRGSGGIFTFGEHAANEDAHGSEAVVTVLLSSLSHNSAGGGDGCYGTGGGGVTLQDFTNVTLSQCRVQNNTAHEGAGGGILANLPLYSEPAQHIALHLQDLELNGNSAPVSSGGAIQLGRLEWYEHRELASLSMLNNSAMNGACVFWTFDPDSAIRPECANCSCRAASQNGSIFATQNVSHTVFWPPDVPASSIFTVSTATITPGITVLVRDFYNATYNMSNAYVSVQLTEDAMEDASASGAALAVSGTTLALHGAEGAAFTSLVLSGTPAHSFALLFRTDVGSIVISAAVSPCQPGEVYYPVGQVCHKCAEGEIKFTNDTDECTPCVDGMNCLGGNEYELVEGYWMASRWIEENCQFTDALCLMEHIYRCEIDAWCGSEEARRNEDGMLHVAMDRLCMEGHSPDGAVLCTQCSDGYYSSDQTCAECVFSWGTALQLAAVLIFIAAAATFMWYNCDLSDSRIVSQQAVNMNKSGTLVKILLGHFQVVGPMEMIFSSDTIPSEFRTFCELCDIWTLNILDWVAFSCVHDNFEHDFFIMLAFYSVVPVIIELITIAMAMQDGTVMRPKVGIAIAVLSYVLILLHPVACTFIFGLFWCNEIYLENAQWWLAIDQRVECYDLKYWGYFAMAMVGLVLYVFGVPFGLAVVPHMLRKYKRMVRTDTGEEVYIHKRELTEWKPDENLSECTEAVFVHNSLSVRILAAHDANRADDSNQVSHFMTDDTGNRVWLIEHAAEDGNERTALMHPRAVHLAPYVMPFKSQYYWWPAYDMLRKLAQTSLVVAVRGIHNTYDLIYSIVVTVMFLAVHASCQPFKSEMVNMFQTLILVSQATNICLLIQARYENYEGQNGELSWQYNDLRFLKGMESKVYTVEAPLSKEEDLEALDPLGSKMAALQCRPAEGQMAF